MVGEWGGGASVCENRLTVESLPKPTGVAPMASEDVLMWLEKSKSGISTAIKIRLRFWSIFGVFLFKHCPISRWRIYLLNLFGAKIDLSSFVHSSAQIYMPWNLEMGRMSSIDFNSIIYCLDKIKIGDFVSIAYCANVNTGFHDLSDPHFQLKTRSVSIEDGAFIGTGAYLSPGVRIGKMAVIGAQSTVTRDMPSGFICYGTPCTPRRKREKNT